MIQLTEAEKQAIKLHDNNYINSKGARLYKEETFEEAAEFYHLAAAMGNGHAISNLGYCYLYGRHTEQNIPLAIAYFEIAAIEHEDIDAAYKLGNIYASEKWGLKDEELSIYYYRMAATLIAGFSDESLNLIYDYNFEEFRNYPSLCLAIGKVLLEGKLAPRDIEQSYMFLLCAKDGYETQIKNGAEFYKEPFEEVNNLLNNPDLQTLKEKEAERIKKYEQAGED